MTFERDQTVYLPDGREAIYVLANGDNHFVRLIYEAEGSYDEPPYSYPSDKITSVREVFSKPPVEVWDQKIIKKREQLRELDGELAEKRKEILDAAKAKTDMEKAAAKYPCIQQALDFIEGRITHVVIHDYGGARICTMQEAFEDVDIWGGCRSVAGMKLLNLFGTDRNGRSVAWGLNRYRDGSGSSHRQIWPAHSEDHARQIVSDLVSEALDAWRSGDEHWGRGRVNVTDTLKANSWLEAPADWAAHLNEIAEQQRVERIARLRAELADLEGDLEGKTEDKPYD